MIEHEKALLLEFLVAWKLWAEGKKLTAYGLFRGEDGLCANARRWNHYVLKHRAEENGDVYKLLCELLNRDFPNGASRVPFNRDGEHFGIESLESMCHHNGKRRQWVDNKIKELA